MSQPDKSKPAPSLEILNIEQMAARYRDFMARADMEQFDLGEWLPSLRPCRPLFPGELCFIVADTGAGKTMALQNIARCAYPASVLAFELELPATLMYERFAALARGVPCSVIAAAAADAAGTLLGLPLDHIFVCDQTRLSSDQMKTAILEQFARLVHPITNQPIGRRPQLVLVDYIGLMNAAGKSRYERMSCAAEDLKILAKETNTIIIAATQMARPEGAANDGIAEPSLHSAKDSGGIEASAGLLLGLWRDATDPRNIGWLRVLKNSKGPSGEPIKLVIEGEKMRISEAARGDFQP